MDPQDLQGEVPWLTPEGYFDPGKYPIDGVLQQAMSKDERAFRSTLNMLRSMYGHGRKEAGVFLLGLLFSVEDDWEKRSALVEAIQEVETQGCIAVLFGELKRVTSSNTTRRYLGTVIKVLSRMPFELIEEGFEALADDKSFSQKMRAKFRAILQQVSIGFDDYV